MIVTGLLFLLVVNCSFIFLGFLLNLFIVLINLTWWLKGKALQSIDIIITCLGSVRILILLIYLSVFYLGRKMVSQVDKSPSYSYVVTVNMFVVFCSLWWATVLGVFYCVKITTSRNQLFVKLKMNISSMVPQMLVGSMVISMVCSLPCLWSSFAGEFTSMDNGNVSSNDTQVYLRTQYVNLLLISLAGAITPLFIFCASIYLLIVSVVKHMRNMANNTSGFASPQLQAHKNAIINMVSFLFFYLLYFITSNLLFLSFSMKDETFVFICLICVSSYPSLHSILLIASNAKLKRSILSPFQALCRLRDGISKR